MNLNDFISSTLAQISKGISDAGGIVDAISVTDHPDYPGSNIPQFTHNKRDVEFDVAITVEESSEKSGGGDIRVLGVFGLGGKGEVSTVQSATSRVRFCVPINLASALGSARTNGLAEESGN